MFQVLQELPIIVVLMYQLYKQYVHQEVAEFIPLIMNTITLQPTPQQRQHKDFNKEVYYVIDNEFNQTNYPDLVGKTFDTPPSYAEVEVKKHIKIFLCLIS